MKFCPHTNYSSVKLVFLEVKQLLLRMNILNQSTKRKQSGCFRVELNSLDCRKGCVVCHLFERLEALKQAFPSMEEGPGWLLMNDTVNIRN